MFATIVPRVFVIIQVYKRSGCLVLSSTVECSRVLSNAVESCRGLVLSNAVGCCRVLSSAAECCRILSSAFEYCRVLSRAVAYVPCSSGFGLLKWSGAGGSLTGMCRSHGPHRVSGTTKTVSKPTQCRRHAPHPSYLGAQVAIRIDDIAAETTTATPQMAIRIARRNSSPKATRGREWHVAKQPTKTWGRTMDRLYGPRLVAKNDRMQGRSGPIQLRK